jgi:hypothetical protein
MNSQQILLFYLFLYPQARAYGTHTKPVPGLQIEFYRFLEPWQPLKLQFAFLILLAFKRVPNFFLYHGLLPVHTRVLKSLVPKIDIIYQTVSIFII